MCTCFISEKVKHMSSLTSHSQPFASLSAKLPTQVKVPTPTQVENPNYVSPCTTGSNSGKCVKIKYLLSWTTKCYLACIINHNL